MSWIEVRFELTGELAEPVAELLARHAVGGVVLEETSVTDNSLKATTQVILRGYLPQDEQLEARKQAIEEGIWHLGQIVPINAPQFDEIPHQDWNESWRQRYQPIEIGKKLLILPAWAEAPETDRKTIILEPGMAFGTGAHPTTRLSLLGIEEYCQDGDTLIDLGCGSGILSIGALRCGAENALALDIDAEALQSAEHNLKLNQLSDQIRLVHGSLAEARQLTSEAGVPLLVANILAPILNDLLQAGLANLVGEGGIMILSGILEDQLDDLLELTQKAGFHKLTLYAEDDWRAIALEKK